MAATDEDGGDDSGPDGETTAGDLSLGSDETLGVLRQWYHVPVLVFFTVFMFWTRLQGYNILRRDGDGFWLLAIDSWYHWRATNWTVQNYPWVIGFDPWTGYPNGRLPGQFGTLFDQIVATVAMAIGLGSPSQQDILLAALITIPAMAALVAIPTYYIGKRLGNRPGGLAGVGLLALFTGEFFSDSIAGVFDHHVAEVLFMSIAVLALIVAFRVGEEEKPIWELVKEGNWDAIRRPTIYSIFAGIAITLYLWTWPPGVLIIGILGIFFVLQLSVDFIQNRSPDHLAFVGIVTMLVVVVGTAIRIQSFTFAATRLDLMPPTFALAVAAGCAYMAGLARVAEDRGLSDQGYLGAVAVSIVVALAVIAVAIPGFVDTILGSLSGRLLPFGYSEGAGTVAEAKRPDNLQNHLYDEFGLAAFFAFIGIALMMFRPVIGLRRRGEHLFIVVWSLVLLGMAATQVRFAYYFTIPVAVLNAHLVGFIVGAMDIPEHIPDLEELDATLQPYQVLTLGMILILLFMPLLPPLASSTPVSDGGERASLYDNEDARPWLNAPKWEQANDWLKDNTPEVGNYGDANNADEFDYYGRFDKPNGELFDYPDGAYGVLSWWDYGHYITAQGERIPHSNPFQQNPVSSSAFLTSQNESQAELYLDAIAAGESPSHESDEDELREAVENAEQTEGGIQYVMIDDDSAAGKFPAITQWTGPDYPDYLSNKRVSFQEGTTTTPGHGPFQDTMIAKLYLEDATGLSHYRLVNEISTYSLVGLAPGPQRISIPYSDDKWSEQDRTFASQLEQARNQNQALFLEGVGAEVYDTHLVSAIKTFERVEGATLTGETEPNSTVTVQLPLDTATNRSFVYEQTVETTDGSFEITVPYPTEETLGPEDGYANSSVRMSDATGGYDIGVRNESDSIIETADNISVPEEEIQTGGTVDVTLEEYEPPQEGTSDGEDGTSDGSDGGS
jgi:oligosaccharyl transferase (archaeosortase A-associated)